MNKSTNSVHALKSKAEKKAVKGVDGRKEGTSWNQPLQKHVNVNTEKVEYVTINVRVLSQVEHDFLARFPPSDSLDCSLVCSVIAEREHLSESEANLFSLWIISKDLELQIRPDQDLFHLLSVWNHWVLKYTHFPEAEDPSHPINRHWFVYKREASASIDAEKRVVGEYSLSMLYGEAIRNFKTSRFIVNNAEAAIIAGYQMHLQRGAYRNEKSPRGCISEDKDVLASLIPPNLINTIKSEDWEDLIIARYKQNQKLSSLECRIGILDFFRNHPCYGGSFFPCCHQLPPSGFFELRQQLWYICVGPNGISVIDTDIHKYIVFIPWEFKEGLRCTKVESGVDVVRIKYYKGDKSKEMALISPQSKIIENLAQKILYIWAKENDVLKKPKKVGRGVSMQIMKSLQEDIDSPSQQTRALALKMSNDAEENSGSYHSTQSRRARHASALVSSGKSLPKDQNFSRSQNFMEGVGIGMNGSPPQNIPGYHNLNHERPVSMMVFPVQMPPPQGYFYMPTYPTGPALNPHQEQVYHVPGQGIPHQMNPR